jgi:tetratricopeptide (TPR) repeat protein
MKTKSQNPGVIILERIDKNGWLFNCPRLRGEVQELLGDAIDWMDTNPRLARSRFSSLIRDYPEFLDAYHHLALTWYREGKTAQAFRIWRKGAELALKVLPANFSMKTDRLQWGFVENRPFLRLYFGYGLALMKNGKFEQALEIFENTLSLNPSDNQGVRSFLVECNFELQRPEAVLAMCDRFPGDCLEHVAYGRVLALFQLGRAKEAAKALHFAVKYLPLIARELLKTRHRRIANWDEGGVVVGSQAQAYGYWLEHGKFWQNAPGALDFLRGQLGKASG